MFSFTKNRFKFYTVATVLTIISIASPFLLGMNLGIDMTGGIQIEYSVDSGDVNASRIETLKDAEEIKKSITIDGAQAMNDIIAYNIAGTNRFIIEAGFLGGGKEKEAKVELAKASFLKSLNEKISTDKKGAISQARYINIGESFGTYIKNSAYLTLTIAIIMISLYIQWAFRGSIAGMASWPFAVVTGASLLHDVIVAFGLYVITSFFFPEFKIDTFFLTALLTILGYSINDTIVVMDRIRSNLHEGDKKISFSGLIDKSIIDTMRRSLFTSSTVFVVLLAMFFFGPDSLKGFTLTLLYGTIVGTYSSVCIASPLLIDITKKK